MAGYDARFWELPFDPGNFDALPGELFDTPADPSGGEECARARCPYRGRTHGKLVQKGEERCQQHSGCRGKLPALSSGAVCLRSRWTARALVRSSTVRPSRFRSSPDITLCGYGPAGTRAEITPSTWPTTTPSTSAVAEPSSGRGGSCPCSSRIWGSCSSGDDPGIRGRIGPDFGNLVCKDASGQTWSTFADSGWGPDNLAEATPAPDKRRPGGSRHESSRSTPSANECRFREQPRTTPAPQNAPEGCLARCRSAGRQVPRSRLWHLAQIATLCTTAVAQSLDPEPDHIGGVARLI